MKPTQQLHELGQSIWLDNIRRSLLTEGTLKHYIDDLSVTGLTSNPTITMVPITPTTTTAATATRRSPSSTPSSTVS